MELLDLTPSTEATFLRCLHDERPDDPRAIGLRRRWLERHRPLGHRAKVLRLESGKVVGMAQTQPIERSHLLGRKLTVVLCIWVHGYSHHVGNRQGRGLGRFMLAELESEARAQGSQGMAAWGMDFSEWNPVSFYEHMGYERVDAEGPVVLTWKRFLPAAQPPRLRRARPQLPVRDGGRLAVDVILGGWCTGSCGNCISAREAVAGLEGRVRYRELDGSDLAILDRHGVSNGIFVGGEAFRPYGPPFTAAELRASIFERLDA